MMKQINVASPLIGREETFKLLAVAQVTKKPILLVGVPGTGKTKSLLDYALAYHMGDQKKAIDSTFILETDESTRSPEIKGRPNMQKLLQEQKWEMDVPVKNTDFLLINEIDKANSGMRNSLLSIMNEKMIFAGKDKIPVPWEVFCASCNKIPAEEKDSPFWDRFVIKHEVHRITRNQMVKYYKTLNGTSKTKPVSIYVPDEPTIAQIQSQIPESKLRKFLNVTYDILSDRTLSFVPKMVAAVSVVYQYDINQSLVKTCEILADKNVATSLSTEIEPAEIADIRSKIDLISSLTDYDQISNMVQDIKASAERAATSHDVTKEDLVALAEILTSELNKNKVWSPDGYVEKDGSAEDMQEMDVNTVPDSNYMPF